MYRQKAPSAKRCIKTVEVANPDAITVERSVLSVRKHRAPKGALRRVIHFLGAKGLILPESTEHQKVH